MNIKRLALAVAVLIMSVLLYMPVQAESVEDVVVLSAPLVRSSDVKDGMVRVWLKDKLDGLTHLDVTVTGSYSINGNTAMKINDGETIGIDFDKQTGAITFTLRGTTYAVSGTELRLRRHQADGESALSIAQAARPSNLYPGDLRLLAVQNNDGTYRLYPILHVYLEYYLKGVVPNEMSSSYPIEALKAQAVAARTFALREMEVRGAYNYDVSDTSSSQVYKGHSATENNATKAVDETKGIIARNGSALTGTYYTASNGGQTEAVKNAWGSTGYDYLKVKDDPFDAANASSNRRRLTIYKDFDHPSQNETLAGILSAAAKKQCGEAAVIESIDSVIPHTPKYAAPSRLYTRMDFGVTVLTSTTVKHVTLSFSIFDELESQLSLSIQSSKNELWSVETLDEGYRITVGRWGHGIGMSQRGAQKMAQMGYTYDQILGFYYEGCERVQYTFTHTILPAGGSGDIVSAEPPAEISPAVKNQATVSLTAVGDTTALRYTASESGKVLIGVPNGAVVTVHAKGEEWSLVRYGQINGYLPTAQLVCTDTPPTTTSQTATYISQWATVTGTNSLNFRTGPGFEHDVQGSLSEGTILCVLGAEGEWVRVQYEAVTGYVSPDYLQMHSSYPGTISSDSSAMVSLKDVSHASLLVEPSMTGTAIMQIADGTQVTVLHNDGSWCRVKVAGVEGYLLTSQLDFGATGTVPTDPPVTQGIRAIVNSDASTLNLRPTPSTEQSPIAEIPKGTTIVVTQRGVSWCAVTWGELKGYVMTKYLNFPDDPTDEPTDAPTDEPTNEPTDSPTTGTDPLPGETPAPEEYTAWVMSTVNYVNLRVSPSTEADVITRIPSGDELAVIEVLGTFTHVRHGVGTGYVLSKHLTYTKPMESIGVMYVNTDVDPLFLRNEPDQYDSQVIVSIPRGEKVMLYGHVGDWSHVQWGDYVGYCATEYLSWKKPTDYAPDDTPIYDPTLTILSGWTALANNNGMPASVRKWCSMEAPELTSIPDGGAVKLLEMGDIWCKISYEGETGYCLTNKLLFIAPD